MCAGGMPPLSHFDDPAELSDPLFFHPQHPRSVENFDLGVFGYGTPGTSPMVEKHGITQQLYPAYQLPGLTYGVRPNGSVMVAARRGNPSSTKRAMDAAPQEAAASAVPNKRRRMTDAAN
jgi:hypothetical protein